jgi:PEP-CTERM motif
MKRLGCVLLAATALPGLASAAIVTLSASSLPVGTDVTNSSSVMTLTSLSEGYLSAPGILTSAISTVAVPCGPDFGPCSVNPDVFSTVGTTNRGFYTSGVNVGCIDGGTCEGTRDGFNFLKITPASPTDYVSVEGQYNSGGGTLGLWAFNSAGQLIDSCTGYMNSSCFKTIYSPPDPGADISAASVTFASSSDNIAYVYAAGYAQGADLDKVSVDAVPVPEPGSLSLLLSGVAAFAIGLARKRKQRIEGGATAL